LILPGRAGIFAACKQIQDNAMETADCPHAATMARLS
jgi:hypothetical protein